MAVQSFNTLSPQDQDCYIGNPSRISTLCKKWQGLIANTFEGKLQIRRNGEFFTITVSRLNREIKLTISNVVLHQMFNNLTEEKELRHKLTLEITGQDERRMSKSLIICVQSTSCNGEDWKRTLFPIVLCDANGSMDI